MASQARSINQYKKLKALKCCANRYYNRQCLKHKNYLYCCTVHLVDSLIITQPTNALIVCHLFLNNFLKHFHCSYNVSIAYRLSSSGSTYSSQLISRVKIRTFRNNIVVAAYPVRCFLCREASGLLPPCTRNNVHKYRICCHNNIITKSSYFNT